MFFEFVQIFEGEGEHKFLPKFAHGTLTDTPPPTIQHFSQTFLLFDLNIFDIWHLTFDIERFVEDVKVMLLSIYLSIGVLCGMWLTTSQ